MKKIIAKHKSLWKDKNFLKTFAVSALFILASLLINHVASVYATSRASNPVDDIILSNFPVVNVDFIVNEGMITFVSFVALLLFLEPKRIPFALKTVALLFIVRSIFVTMTHLGPFPSRSYLDPQDLLYSLNLGGDYFFSGHTSFPFTVALIFWEQKTIRNVALASTAIFAISVLLGHLHYSIDVFSAFFIAYGIFHMSQKLFPADFKLFHRE